MLSNSTGSKACFRNSGAIGWNSCTAGASSCQDNTHDIPDNCPSKAAFLAGDCQDSDGDGLPDTYEATLGTDSNAVDTDGDGISDGDEIMLLNSDPLVNMDDCLLRENEDIQNFERLVTDLPGCADTIDQIRSITGGISDIARAVNQTVTTSKSISNMIGNLDTLVTTVRAEYFPKVGPTIKKTMTFLRKLKNSLDKFTQSGSYPSFLTAQTSFEFVVPFLLYYLHLCLASANTIALVASTTRTVDKAVDKSFHVLEGMGKFSRLT